MLLYKSLFISGTITLLSACASISTGTSQPITVVTPYAEGATCSLRDSAGGSWAISRTPDTATVNKGDGPMTIRCEKSGFKDGATVLNEKFQGATMGNILLGGGIGLIADASTGAAQEYPKDVKVYLEPITWKNVSEQEQWMQEKRQYDQILADLFKEPKSETPAYPSHRR